MPTCLNAKKMYPRNSSGPKPPRAPLRRGRRSNLLTLAAQQLQGRDHPESMNPEQRSRVNLENNGRNNQDQGSGLAQDREQSLQQGLGVSRPDGGQGTVPVLRNYRREPRIGNNQYHGMGELGFRHDRLRGTGRTIRFMDPLSPIYASTFDLTSLIDDPFRRVFIEIVDPPSDEEAGRSDGLRINPAEDRPFSPLSSESGSDSESDAETYIRVPQYPKPAALEHQDLDSSESLNHSVLLTPELNFINTNFRTLFQADYEEFSDIFSDDSDTDSLTDVSYTSGEYETEIREIDPNIESSDIPDENGEEEGMTASEFSYIDGRNDDMDVSQKATTDEETGIAEGECENVGTPGGLEGDLYGLVNEYLGSAEGESTGLEDDLLESDEPEESPVGGEIAIHSSSDNDYYASGEVTSDEEEPTLGAEEADQGMNLIEETATEGNEE